VRGEGGGGERDSSSGFLAQTPQTIPPPHGAPHRQIHTTDSAPPPHRMMAQPVSSPSILANPAPEAWMPQVSAPCM